MWRKEIMTDIAAWAAAAIIMWLLCALAYDAIVVTMDASQAVVEKLHRIGG